MRTYLALEFVGATSMWITALVALGRREGLDSALAAMERGDTLVVTTLDRLGRNAHHMIGLANRLRDEGEHLRGLNLGGEAINTSSPTGAMLFQVMAAIAEMEHAIKKERIRDSNEKHSKHGGDLGGRHEQYDADAIHGIQRDIELGHLTVSEAVAKRGMSRQTYYRRSKALQDAAARSSSAGSR